MKERPYHHLPDGTFRNPKGSPVIISRSGKFSYRTFSKLRKKVDLSYPKEHVIEKEKVLANLEKYKNDDEFAVQLKEAISKTTDEELKKELILEYAKYNNCLLYTSPSPRDKRQSRMPSSA